MSKTEIKKEIFTKADLFFACSNDPAFDDEEQEQFAVMRFGVIEILQSLGWFEEYMGIAQTR